MRPIVLVCTGLGRINRGFEQYISSLAIHLSTAPSFRQRIEVWSGGKVEIAGVTARKISSLPRDSRMIKKSRDAFLWEQRSFFIGMIPALLHTKPSVIYLGEYQLYCYLYKIRKALGLKYSLVLYTGGQAIPGASVFDSGKDFVHHVTYRYLHECTHIPKSRQAVLPHFIEQDFVYSSAVQNQIKRLANGKQVVLSVGLLDDQTKRTGLLVDALVPLKQKVFPVFLGAESPETKMLRQKAAQAFGENGFLMMQLPHPLLGDYYAVADVFVSCSPKESFGLAMVEALYHGLPVICSNFQEVKFVLKDKVWFVTTIDKADWTATILEHLETKEVEAIGNNRKNFVREHYTWQALQSGYSEMFNSI